MASDLVIRDARPDEREVIRALTLDAYAQYAQVMSPTSWAALLGAVIAGLATDEPAERIVAERAGVLAGSVMLFPANRRSYGSLAGVSVLPELRLLAVAPHARGGGVGRMLVEECISRARNSVATALALHTAYSMTAAVALYERMGFIRVPADDFQPEGSELVIAYQAPL